MIPSGDKERINFIQDIKITSQNTGQKKEVVHATGLLNGRPVKFTLERKGMIDERMLRKYISDSFVGKTKQYDTFNVTELVNKNINNLKIKVTYSDISVAEKLQEVKASRTSLNNIFKKTDSTSKQVFNQIKRGFEKAEKFTESAKNNIGDQLVSTKDAVNREATAAATKAKELRDGVAQLYADAKFGVNSKYEEVKTKLKSKPAENDYEIKIEELKDNQGVDETMKMSESEAKKTKQDFQFELLRDYFLHSDKYKGKFIDLKEGEFVVVTEKPKNCKEIGQKMIRFLDDRYDDIDLQMEPLLKKDGPSSEKLEGLGMQIMFNQAVEEKIMNRNNDNPYAPPLKQK